MAALHFPLNQDTGIEALFPLWGLDTTALAYEMLRSGLRAIVTSVDTSRLDASFAGREYDSRFLEDLPGTADPCGENGEFHSFLYAGPMFSQSLRVKVGESMDHDGFVFADAGLA